MIVSWPNKIIDKYRLKENDTNQIRSGGYRFLFLYVLGDGGIKVTKAPLFFNSFVRWYYPLRWLILILLGLAIYAQTFGFEFVFDDDAFIVTNPYIRNFSQVYLIWHHFPLTRSVGIYSFALNYFFNQLHPWGYHLFNFIVHLLAAGLVWALARMLFKITKIPEDSFRREIPFMIAVLFLVHPCQTQAVTYISQRFESMATVFYLGTMYCYLRARVSMDRAHKIRLFGQAGLLTLAGILTKEVAVTVPAMMLAAEWILFPKKENKRIYIVLAVGGVLLYVLFSKLVHADLSIFLQSIPSQSHDGDVLTPSRYFLTQMRVFLTFLRLLVLPIHQNVDYDYPASSGLLHPPLTLVGLCVIGGIIFLIIKLRRDVPLIAFGLAWVLITFSINLAPRSNVIFEHKLYLISFGFFLTAVVFLSKLVHDRRTLVKILWCMITVLALVSYQRNKVWKDAFTLWNDAVRKSPHKARAYNNRGLSFENQGNFLKAISDFNKAIEIDPEFVKAYNNRGMAYGKQGNLSQAISDFNKANAKEDNSNQSVSYDKKNFYKLIAEYTKSIEMNPKNIEVNYYARGRIYLKLDKFIQAISDFNKAIEINPKYAEAYNYRGIAYGKQGNLSQANADFIKAKAYNNMPVNSASQGKLSEINSTHKEDYFNRGADSFDQGNVTLAISDYNKAIKMAPNDADAYNNRGSAYYIQGNFIQAIADLNEAISYYNKANKINHNYADAYYNRGLVYLHLDNFTQAISDFNQAIEMNPKDAMAYYNRGIAYYQQGRYNQAITDLTKVIELGSDIAQVRVYNTRASANYQLGNYEMAWKDVHKAEELGVFVDPKLISVLKEASGRDK